MTRMFGFGPDAPPTYYQCGFQIMMAIYYLSRLAQDQPDTPETTQGRPGFVFLPFADPSRSNAAPTIQIQLPAAQNQQPMPAAQNQQPMPPQQFGWYNQSTLASFEPWKKENQLGFKSWIVELLPDRVKIVLKMWAEDDDTKKHNEAKSYNLLKPLWGTCVPSFIAEDSWEHSNSIALEYIEVPNR